jgi:FAD/FMN-containing dehydrogenase
MQMVSKQEVSTMSTRSSTNGEHAYQPLAKLGYSLPDLRAAFTGEVITPGDEKYDSARAVFYGGIDRHPALIVRAAGVADVQQAVALARQAGVDISIRSGGHSGAGHSVCEGGIMLDLRNLRGMEIDAENRTAWAEAGLTAGEYTSAANSFGLATGFGDTGSVGIGGITLGGGIGYLVRKYGMTIDDLLAAEIVTADSKQLLVDEENHPDLFWAIRGGGGNFGVVTRFQFRLHPVDQVYGGMLVLPAAAEVIAGFMAAAEAAPEELGAIANVMAAPPMPFLPEALHGKMILMALMVYAGDAEAGERALAPFRALAEPLFDQVRPIRYPEMFPPEDDSYHPTAVGHTMFVNRIDLAEAETILKYLQESDAVMRVAQLRVLGGAMARVPVEATAYAHRQAPIMVNLAAFYTTPEDREVREAWLADFAAAVDQGVAGAYVNFLGEDGAGQIESAYPRAVLERLAVVKARYDPQNLFRWNHNIAPAG